MMRILASLVSVPRRWRQRWHVRFPADPRLDTPAGSMRWVLVLAQKKAGSALDAFAVVRNLRHGTELYGIAHALVNAQEAADLGLSPPLTPSLKVVHALPDPELRPGTLAALRNWTGVRRRAWRGHSVSALSRSAALGRANAALTRLIETGGETCPEPEWPLIKNIAETWRGIISKAGGVVGEEVLRQPVPNPYEGYPACRSPVPPSWVARASFGTSATAGRAGRNPRP